MAVAGQSTAIVQLAALPWSELLYHVCIMASAWWLVSRASLTGTILSSVVAGQLALGIVILALTTIEPNSVRIMHSAWAILTMLVMLSVVAGLSWRFKRERSPESLLLMALSVSGAMLVLSDVWPWLDQARSIGPHAFGVMHALWLGSLVLLSLHMSGRLTLWTTQRKTESSFEDSDMSLLFDPDKQGAYEVGAQVFSSLSSLDLSSSSESILQNASWLSQASEQQRSLSEERKRIAQDIHDGVGSQLTSLIAGLDQGQPAHKQLALSLEGCLVALKSTVDRLDDDKDTNIFDELGRLRYRFHPALQRAGIRLHWRVEPHGPLMRLTALQRQHVQRIVQEAMTNVLVHSNARNVRLACRFEEAPQSCMLIEVVDNGVGISHTATNVHMGRGLSGFRRRAEALNAKLSISTQEGVGTRIRLWVPISIEEYKNP
jgi:signal transduction histidine kinase